MDPSFWLLMISKDCSRQVIEIPDFWSQGWDHTGPTVYQLDRSSNFFVAQFPDLLNGVEASTGGVCADLSFTLSSLNQGLPTEERTGGYNPFVTQKQEQKCDHESWESHSVWYGLFWMFWLSLSASQ